MNERIEDLVGKAKFMAEVSINKKISANTEELYAFAEEFAELIVKECAGVGYDASYYECALNVSNKIKEHFGIEE